MSLGEAGRVDCAPLGVAMRVFCDFDGTITRQDCTDAVLEALAGPAWRRLQADWEAGRLTGAACLRGQVNLIRGDVAELDAVLDHVDLDPGFAPFVGWCEARGIPVGIVSDGVDYFIHRLLGQHGLERLPVVSNRLAGRAGAWRLEHPAASGDCAIGSGVCKCAATGVLASAETMIFVGDGRSDFCVASRADILFAKGALAVHAEETGQPYLPFETFHDVWRGLAILVGERRGSVPRSQPT